MSAIYRIVVGVDGSEGAQRALRWAIQEASSRGATVRAISAYSFDETDLSSPASQQYRQEAIQQTLSTQIAAALDHNPNVRITIRVVAGLPADVLLDGARDANMLVLGSHGRGRLFRAVLGSVAEACVRRAVCPVVVIPVRRTDQTPTAPELGS